MPIFQTIADYDKWRRRELRKKLLRTAAENSVVHIASEAGGPTAFYERYGNYRPKAILKGTERNSPTRGGGRDPGKQVKNPKGGPLKGKSPAQRGGITPSQVFEDSFGGITYLGSAIEANYEWKYVQDRTSIIEPDLAKISDGTIVANAEPGLLPSADAARLRINQGNNDFIYIEFHVEGSPDGDPWDETLNRSLAVGFSGDSNGIAAASVTNSKGVSIVMNGVFRIYTRKYLFGIQQEENDNSAANSEVLANPEEGFWIGVLSETDNAQRTWTHINGNWLTTGANGGDPDAGGAGYVPSATGGTYWMCPSISSSDNGNFAGTDLRVTITGKPKYVPALATLTVNV